MKGGPHPEGVPRSLVYPEIPLYAFLENSARKHPDREALVFYGARLSYSRLWGEARAFAAAIRRLGVRRGDRVGLLMPNVPQFVVAFYGILAAGGVAVPVNPLNTAEEGGRELEATEARALIVLDRFMGFSQELPLEVVVAEAEAYLPTRLRVLIRLRRGRATLPRGAKRFEELVKGPPLEAEEAVDPRRDLAIIQHTGGTTGPPKGVMLTHFSLVANALQAYFWTRGWGHSLKPLPAGHPVVVCAIPFFHIYGLTVALNEAILSSSTLVLVPDPRPDAIMSAVDRYAATHLPATPQMVRGIVEHPRRRRYDLGSLAVCVTGGGPMDPALARRFEEVTGARLHHGYGLTEAGPITHCTPADAGAAGVGLPLPDTEARIVDLQLGEVEQPSGREGELVVRGPQLMAGYWRDPEATAGALRGGWLYTGDIARLDDEGYLHIVDRKLDRIVAEGRTVWPSEVEEVLRSHPAVEEAAVLGVPDPLRCATDLRAFVALRPGWSGEAAERELMELCGSRLQPHQVPARLEFVESLPRTPLGKVDRRALAEALGSSA